MEGIRLTLHLLLIKPKIPFHIISSYSPIRLIWLEINSTDEDDPRVLHLPHSYPEVNDTLIEKLFRKQNEIANAQEQADQCSTLGNDHRIQIIWIVGNRG